MGFVVYSLLNPLPVTTVKEVSLSDLEFPIVFKLCAHLMWDDDLRYWEVGYQDEEMMYLGQSKYDPRQFGWSGHSENGSHLDISGIWYGPSLHCVPTLEILRRTNVDWSSIIESVGVGEAVVIGRDIQWTSVQHFSHCTSLDPALYFRDLPEKDLLIAIKKTEHIGVTIFIEDKEEAVGRAIKSNLQVYSGAKITLTNANMTWDKKFIISFTQHKFSDRDTREQAKRCTNYPTEKFNSFADCDGDFLRSKCQTIGAGIVPFWATGNLSEVTRSAGDLRQKVELLRDLYSGRLESDCLPPCRSTTVVGTELSEVCTSQVPAAVFS